MYATLIEIDVREVDREEGLRGLQERIVPAISGLPGFRSGVWLTGNEAGIGLSLTVWDSEPEARVMAERLGVGSSPQASASVTRCRGARSGSHGRPGQRVNEGRRTA